MTNCAKCLDSGSVPIEAADEITFEACDCPEGQTFVPRDVQGLVLQVRQTGLCNMFDLRCVTQVLEEALDEAEAAQWIRAHKEAYAKGIMTGWRTHPAEEDIVY